MRIHGSQLGSLSVPLIVVAALGVSRAWGDSLTVGTYKDSYLLYEPLVVEVTLHLDDPFIPGMEDPREALEQLRRLRRRLYVELRDDKGEKMSKALVCGTEFLPSEEPRSEFRASGLAFPQAPERGGDFVPWEETGSFLLVVQDRERRLESNTISVSIRSPSRLETRASQIFREALPEAAKVMLEAESGNRSWAGLERLARDYPETVYGKYAIVSLALVRWKETFKEHNNKGEAEVWGPVAAELTKAATLFDGAHRLRERVLFDLARAHAFAGQSSEARRTAETLSSEFPDGEFGRKAQAMLAELDE
jgi:hypothetical protein